MKTLALYLLAIINVIAGLFILGTIGMMEHFQEISISRIIGLGTALAFYFIEYQIMKEL